MFEKSASKTTFYLIGISYPTFSEKKTFLIIRAVGNIMINMENRNIIASIKLDFWKKQNFNYIFNFVNRTCLRNRELFICHLLSSTL